MLALSLLNSALSFILLIFLIISLLCVVEQTGERYKVDTPICSAVLSTIQSLEASILSTTTFSDESFLKGDGGTYSRDANSMQGRMFLIYRAFSTATSDRWHGHPGVWEATYRMSQAAAVLLMSCYLLYELL
jgi:hypothetical protein